jgi:hypothetical protein
MSGWDQVLQQVRAATSELGAHRKVRIFFRGQRNAEWGLQPSLARYERETESPDPVKSKSGKILRYSQRIENSFYYQLLARGGHLLPRHPSPWEILFLMRHHGIPTRLLDWTTSFATALYFALGETRPHVNEAETDAAIWILSPGQLNRATRGLTGDSICYLNTDYPIGYEEYFANHLGDHYGTFPHNIIATWSDSSNERLRLQRGAFTLHADLTTRLDRDLPACVRKLIIPPAVQPAAHEFLALAGVDTTSLFSDLDTLSTFIVQSIVGQ